MTQKLHQLFAKVQALDLSQRAKGTRQDPHFIVVLTGTPIEILEL